jgi:DNA polymerase-3 subunit gamma/tau
MVFYRKYRPQLIDDLDNATVRETLSSVLKNSQTHAFLFTGPKGLGKTSTARIIAKVVNCIGKKRNGIEPCNECDQCISITEGTNLDVLEIDAASNRGIDEIRDLKDKIRLAPVSASKKVYIIDEVHMLTTEAFNALLKTLEEPPSHAMFILCTTEPHKIPATILSRCFHINFSLATDDEIVRSLKRVVMGEKIKIDEEVLFTIAKMADGGFRDATKILEEVTALADGKKITAALIEEKYKVAGIEQLLQQLLQSLREENVKGSLEIVKASVEQGIDTKHFIQRLIEFLHTMLIMTVSEKDKQAEFSLEEIIFLVDLFSKAYTDTKTAVIPQLPLELAIIEYRNQLAQGVSQVQTTEIQVTQTKNESGVTVSSLRKQIGTIKKVQALYGTPKTDDKNEPSIKTTTVELMKASPNGEITTEWLDAFWKNLISEMKSFNHTIAGVLRGCSIKSFDKQILVIETLYQFHKDKLSEMKTLAALEQSCKLLTGKNVSVKVELKT